MHLQEEEMLFLREGMQKTAAAGGSKTVVRDKPGTGRWGTRGAGAHATLALRFPRHSPKGPAD